MRRFNKEAIINAGTPGCRHYEGITSEEEYGGHLIGRCRNCPRVIDYTVAQSTLNELKQWRRRKSQRGQEKAMESLQRQKEAKSAIPGD